MAQSDATAELARRYEQQKRQKFPRGGPNSEDFGDIAVRLAEYDGYLAGLIERYLRRMPLATDSIAFPQALENAFEHQYGADASADAFRQRWADLRRLAELLSQAAAVPLKRVPG